MKKISLLIAILLFFVCCKNKSEVAVEYADETTVTVTKTACMNEVYFGNTAICLPEIKGIIEAYSNSKVKLRANEFQDGSNTILGYYLDDETYKKVENFADISYDNYYKIYASAEAIDIKIGNAEMREVANMMTAGLLDKTLEDVNESNVFGEKEIKISQPVLVEKYSLTSASSTMIIFMRISNQETDSIKAISMTSAVIKERLVFVAHYLEYRNEETVSNLKEHTATFMNAFFEANT